MLLSLLFHKKVIEKRFEKVINANTAVAQRKIILIINNIDDNNQLECINHVISHVKVINSELNQFKGKIQAIAIAQIKKLNHNI